MKTRYQFYYPTGLRHSRNSNDEQTEAELPAPIKVQRGLNHINGATQYLLQYFSDHIAPTTAVIARGFNGYRDLILPLAEFDPFMQGAVLAVSMQHILLRFGGDAVDSVKAYNATIQGLIARSYHCPPDQDISCRVVLLLLHLREVMSGSNDFKFLYGSLRALQNTATTSITRGSIGFSHQLAEVRLFAEALFDEACGVQYLLTQGARCLDGLNNGH